MCIEDPHKDMRLKGIPNLVKHMLHIPNKEDESKDPGLQPGGRCLP